MHELAHHFRSKGGVEEYCQEDSNLLIIMFNTQPIYTSITSVPDDLSQFSVSVPVPVPTFRDFQLPYLC